MLVAVPESVDTGTERTTVTEQITTDEIGRRLNQTSNDVMAVYTKLSKVEDRLDVHDIKLDGIRRNLEAVDGRLHLMDGRFDDLESRVDGVATRVTLFASD